MVYVGDPDCNRGMVVFDSVVFVQRIPSGIIHHYDIWTRGSVLSGSSNRSDDYSCNCSFISLAAKW